MIDATEKILKAIKLTLNLKKNTNTIGLHEPHFEDTNASKYINDCLESCWVSSSGNWVSRFEDQICKFTGAKYAIAVSNGTVGLRLSLHCIGVQAGDEVITSPLTFVATANAISHLGAYPHFVDINDWNLSLSSNSLAKRLKKIAIKKGNQVFNTQTGRRISAILPVHVFGMPADTIEIKKIAEEWGIPIVEDAAEALGSRHFIKKDVFIHAGLIGDIGVISFNGNKLITTGGGGIVITNNERLALKCKHLSTTAKKKHRWEFDHDEIAWNDRMPNINAALGFAQLEVIDKRLKQKYDLLKKYQKFFSEIQEVEFILDKSKNINNYWLINIRSLIKDKKKAEYWKNNLLEKCHKNKILIRPAWKLLHKLEIYKDHPRSNLEIAEDQSYRILSLPSSSNLFVAD